MSDHDEVFRIDEKEELRPQLERALQRGRQHADRVLLLEPEMRRLADENETLKDAQERDAGVIRTLQAERDVLRGQCETTTREKERLQERIDSEREFDDADSRRVQLKCTHPMSSPSKGTVVDVGQAGLVVDWDNGPQKQYIAFEAVEPLPE